MHYKPLERMTLHNYLQVSKATTDALESWHQLSKSLLLRKASMSYYALAKEHMSVQKYGYALKHIRFALHCLGECLATGTIQGVVSKFLKMSNRA